jgi:hypothetical protein
VSFVSFVSPFGQAAAPEALGTALNPTTTSAERDDDRRVDDQP